MPRGVGVPGPHPPVPGHHEAAADLRARARPVVATKPRLSEATRSSLVLLVLVLVSVNVKSAVPGAGTVRTLTAGLHERMRSMMVDDFGMLVDDCSCRGSA